MSGRVAHFEWVVVALSPSCHKHPTHAGSGIKGAVLQQISDLSKVKALIQTALSYYGKSSA